MMSNATSASGHGIVVVRRAEDSEAVQLLELMTQFDNGDVMTDVTAVRESLNNNPTEKVFVASLEDSLVGFLSMQLTHSFAYQRPTAEVTNVFVTESQRRRGIGSRLIQEARRYCEESHSLELFLRVSIQNERANLFYRNNGLVRADHHEYRIKYYGPGNT